MKDNFFTVLRGGVHTSFQDLGFQNLQHLGITTGGVIDNNLFHLANKLLGNKLNTPILEFTNQGPLLDLKKGRCVRLTKGDFKSEKIYNEDPINQAEIFYEAGLNNLHIVDLDGALEGNLINLDIILTLSTLFDARMLYSDINSSSIKTFNLANF